MNDVTTRIAGRIVVASVSGGKDSAAMSLYLRELGIEHRRVFMDTGWEHDATYEYLRGELTRVLGPIEEIRGPQTMEELIRKKGMFPSRQRRFCTEDLKVRPMFRYIEGLLDEALNTVGIRAGESLARSKMPEWEQPPHFPCEVWRPIIAWSEQDVIDIHRRHGLRPNPLYLQGASRVGCWPCIMARKGEIRMIADKDPARIDRLRVLEAEVTEQARARYEAKTPEEQATIGPFQSRSWFQATTGRSLTMPIDEVVAWARTPHGMPRAVGQAELFAPDHAADGCMRWGMCDTPHEENDR